MMVAPCAISNRSSKRGSGYTSLTVMALIPLQSTTYLLLPSFLGTKKVGAATSDREGRIILASCNSCKVSNSACCSALVSRYLLAGFGSCFSHPSIKSILKFQSPLSFGIFLALRSLNPSRYSWSSIGTCSCVTKLAGGLLFLLPFPYLVAGFSFLFTTLLYFVAVFFFFFITLHYFWAFFFHYS